MGDFYFVNVNPDIVTYYWKGVLTRKIMALRKGFYDNPGQCHLTVLKELKRLFCSLNDYIGNNTFVVKLKPRVKN